MSERDRWQVPPEAAGERLDRYLAGRYDLPRNQVAGWIRAGRVLLDGRPGKASSRLEEAVWIDCEPLARATAAGLAPEEGPLAVLHEDGDIVVVDKPAGLVVHPGAGREAGTLVHRLLARYPEIAEVGGPGRPGIVHRLDRDTTGVLVVARSARAYRRLSEAFARRAVAKLYLAICYGTPSPPEGVLEGPIGRHPRRRKEMTVQPGGRPARTGYRLVASAAGISLVEVDLATGRTHQVRVHLKDAGHPLVGDPVYGEARWRGLPGAARAPLRDFPRPALHAWRLAFVHPASGERVEFEAPVPDDLVVLWRAVAGADPPLPRAERRGPPDPER